MRLLLPPSETKRDGGVEGTRLDLAALSFPSLAAQRRAALASLARVSRSVSASMLALKLSDGQRAEIERNRTLRSSPTMPAVDRFTGVLFDALDAGSAAPAARRWLDDSVIIHSALFGLVGALDPLPAYRLSHDSRLPDLPLKKHWSAAVSSALAGVDGLILDARSDGYVGLGPLPERDNVFTLRVLTETAGGVRRPLNHFNKRGKGEFARALADADFRTDEADELLAWAASVGIRLERAAPGVLALVV
jgi:cytoplasmic iron level regulating protein YaaA (DUF328/UPF0246 family)